MRDFLQSQIDHLASLVTCAVGIVAIGVVLEVTEVIHDFVVWIIRKRREKREGVAWETLSAVSPVGKMRVKRESWDRHKLVRWCLRFGIIAVAVGVVAEFEYGSRLEDAHNAMHTYDLKEIAQLYERAERERLARTQLEAKVAWRSLADSQKADIGAVLRHFPKMTVAVGYEGIDAESASFASDIADALQATHVLNVVSEGGSLHVETPTLRKGHIVATMDTGVLVVPMKDKTSKLLASAISKELNSRGFDARVGKPESQMRVDVGPRPIGAQGEYKLRVEKDAKTKIAASY